MGLAIFFLHFFTFSFGRAMKEGAQSGWVFSSLWMLRNEGGRRVGLAKRGSPGKRKAEGHLQEPI